MELTNSKLKLLKYNESDFELYKEMRMCPNMMEHVYDPFTLDEVKERFKVHLQEWSMDSKDWLSFSITLISTGDKVGDIGLKVVDKEKGIGEVGYMVKPGFQGKGIAFEALSLIKEFAFNKLKLNKLIAKCSTKNEASFSLLEKHGFAREATLEQCTVINNEYVDDFVYGLYK